MGNASEVTVNNITISAVHPVGYISAPTAGASINAGTPVNVIGSASDASNFNSYSLAYIEGTNTGGTFTTFVSNSSPKTDEILGVWNTTGLSEGIHTLRLRVLDTDLNITTAFVQVSIKAPLSITGIPDAVLSEDGMIADFVHLPDYASALVGDVNTMDYSIVSVSDANAGVTLDVSNNIDIEPAPDWNGVAVVTVRIDDGNTTNDDVFNVTVLPVNDPPPAPGVSVSPASAQTSDNIVANVVVQSIDIESGSVSYTYRWYKSADGLNFGSVQRTFGPTAALSDTLPSAQTAEGDFWRVDVTPNDGSIDGDPGSALARVLAPSTIALGVTPSTITLGASTTLSGSISPPVGAGTAVAFGQTTSPAGGTDTEPPSTLTLSNSTYSRSFTPDEAGAWNVVADWAGNNANAAAASPTVVLTVSKAQPTIEVSLSHTAAANPFTNLTATATVNAPLAESIRDILAGRTVNLQVFRPANSQAGTLVGTTVLNGTLQSYEAVFDPSDFTSILPSGFNVPGTWRFRGELEADNDFNQAVTPPIDDPLAPFLTIRDGAGYAIICVGKLDENGEGLPEHTKTADFVYRTLRQRGFSDHASNASLNDIYYMRTPALPLPSGVLVDDTTPSKAELQTAITSWALNKMNNEGAAPLYIILLDHGSEEIFYLFNTLPYNATRLVTPGELDGWLDTLQNNLTGSYGDDGTPKGQAITLVYGACHSGSFLDDLSDPVRPNRILISSSRTDEISHRGQRCPRRRTLRDRVLS